MKCSFSSKPKLFSLIKKSHFVALVLYTSQFGEISLKIQIEPQDISGKDEPDDDLKIWTTICNSLLFQSEIREAIQTKLKRPNLGTHFPLLGNIRLLVSREQKIASWLRPWRALSPHSSLRSLSESPAAAQPMRSAAGGRSLQ
jgi:hypothetical protein